MPHIIAEYSSDLKSSEIIEMQREVQKFMSGIKDANFNIEQCKLREIAFDNFYNGLLSQKESAFIHLTIKILEGRSKEIKEELAKGVVKIIEKFLLSKNLQKKRLDVSVDIVDMNRDFYQKNRIGS
jgi:5-carboxymethyl-2-hydroxymuconate isomerase